ncbi:MAG TPA: DUF3617 domain-containing protein [Gammaproteobacteria bacterium]|nr:DUF3617 domain-containing protein [Gammaproteobacteria bacterium]
MSAKTLLVAACLIAPAALAADNLDVKTGLWELKTSSESTGLPALPPQIASQLTPEQRAKLEENVKKQLQAAQNRTQKICVTKDDLGRPFASLDFKECTQTIVAQTSTSQEVKLACTGTPSGSGTLRIAVKSAEAVTGTIDLTLGTGQTPMTSKTQFQAHWLGNDCAGAPRLVDQ